MNHNVMLRVASLLSLLLLTLHLTDDVVRGMFPPGIGILYAAIVSGVLLYVMLVLAERRNGAGHHAHRFAHCGGNARHPHEGVGRRRDRQVQGGFFFVGTLVALGAIGTFTFILSVRALLSPQSGQPR